MFNGLALKRHFRPGEFQAQPRGFAVPQPRDFRAAPPWFDKRPIRTNTSPY
jgi:hypothetical protein